MTKKILILISIFMTIFSCSSHSNIEKYKDKTPKFDIIKYFSGETEAFGMLQNRSGEVTRRFKVKMIGKTENDKFVLQEYFDFDDGEKQERVWTVKMTSENTFIANAGDIIGDAKGTQIGNALQMNYVLQIPYNGKKMNVVVDDWMYLIDEKSLINTSEIKKFGFVVARLTISFKKK